MSIYDYEKRGEDNPMGEKSKEPKMTKRYVVRKNGFGFQVCDADRSDGVYSIQVWSSDSPYTPFQRAKARRIAKAIADMLNKGGLK